MIPKKSFTLQLEVEKPIQFLDIQLESNHNETQESADALLVRNL